MAVQPRAAGFIDFPHANGAYRGRHNIRAELIAGRECHLVPALSLYDPEEARSWVTAYSEVGRAGRGGATMILPGETEAALRGRKGRNATQYQNAPTEQLARTLASLTGESLTDAIRTALQERYDRLRRTRAGRSLADELNQIGRRCAQRPRISPLTDDEILGYDEFGAPTQCSGYISRHLPS